MFTAGEMKALGLGRLVKYEYPAMSKWKGAVKIDPSIASSLARIAERSGQNCVVISSPFSSWAWLGQVPKKKRPVCGARTRAGGCCKARAVPGMERCRMHGGLSTGPKTEEGRQRIIEANRRRKGKKRPARLNKT